MKKTKTPTPNRAVKWRPCVIRWRNNIFDEFVIEPHDAALVDAMADTLEEYHRLGDELEAAGSRTYNFGGQIRIRPEVAAMDKARVTFARLRRELCLPSEEPEPSRVPRMNGARK